MDTGDQTDDLRSFLVNIINDFLTFKKTEIRSFEATKKHKAQSPIYDNIIDSKVKTLMLKRPDIDFLNLKDKVITETGVTLYNSSNIRENIESIIKFMREKDKDRGSEVYTQFLSEADDTISYPLDYFKFLRFFNKCKQTIEFNIYKRFYNYIGPHYFALLDPKNMNLIKVPDFTFTKDTAVIVSRRNHASALYISLSSRTVYNFDPSFINPDNAFKERVFPFMLMFPELHDFEIVNVIDVNIQAKSETDENIDIYCKAWVVHFLTYILMYRVSIEEYSFMLSRAVVGGTPERLLNEVKEFIIRELSETELEKLRQLLPYYKKYIKYKMKYITLLNKIKNI